MTIKLTYNNNNEDKINCYDIIDFKSLNHKTDFKKVCILHKNGLKQKRR